MHRGAQRIAAAAVAAAILASAPLAAAGRRRPIHRSAGIEEVHRVLVVVLENQDPAKTLAQPFLGQLAARGAYLRNYHAVARPSQPNYFAMTAGSTFGVTNNNPVVLDVPSIATLLEKRGLRWKAYAEGYPGGCFTGVDWGLYVRRHMPFISYAEIQLSPTRCANIVNATEFDVAVASRTLPDFSFYVPDLENDAHNTGIEYADAWLRTRFGSLLEDPGFMDGMLFVVTFDEADVDPANTIYTVFFGAGVRSGFVSDRPYDHYSLLRTIEQIFHTGTLGQADATASVIDDVWTGR